MEILGVGGSTVKPPGMENPGGVGGQPGTTQFQVCCFSGYIRKTVAIFTLGCDIMYFWTNYFEKASIIDFKRVHRETSLYIVGFSIIKFFV